jgi:hypothetical protein
MAYHMCQFLRKESILDQRQHAVFHILLFHHTVSHFHSKLKLVAMVSSSHFTSERSMQSEASCCLFRLLLANLGIVSEFGYDQFLPNIFQFIIHWYLQNSIMYSLRTWYRHTATTKITGWSCQNGNIFSNSGSQRLMAYSSVVRKVVRFCDKIYSSAGLLHLVDESNDSYNKLSVCQISRL